MKNFLRLVIVLTIIIFTGCRAKDNCELNNTGKISVTNNTEREIEIILENTKIFTVQAGASAITDKPVGNYSLKALSFPDEWNYEITVSQCETTQINIPE